MSIFKRKDPAAKDTQGQIIDDLVARIKKLDDEGLSMLFKSLGISENSSDGTTEPEEFKDNLDVYDETAKQAETKEVEENPESVEKEITEEKAVETLEDEGLNKEVAHIAVEGEEAVKEETEGAAAIGETDGETLEQGESEVINTDAEQSAENTASEVPEQDNAETGAEADSTAATPDQTDTINVLLARIDSLEAQVKALTETPEKVKEADEAAQEYGGITKKSVLADSSIPRNSDGTPRTREEWRKMYENG